MLVSTSLSIPKLIPDNWDKWWTIWKEYAEPLIKTGVSPNSKKGLHTGFDVYMHPLCRATYKARFCDLKTIYPSLFNDLRAAVPLSTWGIRFVSSKGDFSSHVDNAYASWSMRCMFVNTDSDSQWHYTRLDNSDKKKLVLPDSTNWWAYLDGKIKHGTTYNESHPKILVQIFAPSKSVSNIVDASVPNVSLEYQIHYD